MFVIKLEFIDYKFEGELFHCFLDLIVPKRKYAFKRFEKANLHTEKKINLKDSADVRFEKIKEDKEDMYYKIHIIGKGYDSRCKWCIKFRETLLKYTKDVRQIKFKQDNYCDFGPSNYEVKHEM